MRLRPCLGSPDRPGCTQLTTGSRCEPCRLSVGRARERKRGRPSSTRRGLGAEHRRVRKAVLVPGAECHLCGGPIDLTLAYPHPQSGVAHHVVPRVDGGQSTLANERAAHKRCNEQHGAGPR